MRAQVAVLRTRPDTVVEDYGRLLRLARYQSALPRDGELLVKLNLSWTKYFPACSTQPWQLDGVVRALLEDGYRPERIHPVENKTVVTNPARASSRTSGGRSWTVTACPSSRCPRWSGSSIPSRARS